MTDARERRPSLALTLIVDDDFHVLAMHAPPALVVDNATDAPSISRHVESAAKLLGPAGGVAVLNLSVVMRITPLVGEKPLRVMTFEELRTRSEDSTN